MAKHTAAPWLIASEDKTFVYALGPMKTNKFWAHVQYAGPEKINKEEAAANALLISAAPELLDSLQEMVNWFGSYPEFTPSEEYYLKYRESIDKARAAIAKATGQCLKGKE